MNGTTTAEIVTNCSQPGCGMLEPVYITAGVAVVMFIIGLIVRAH